MWEIRISREEIEEMMKELDERKAIGPDGVSGYILKECRQEMAEPIHDKKQEKKSQNNGKELM